MARKRILAITAAVLCASALRALAQGQTAHSAQLESRTVQAPISAESKLVVVRAVVVDKKLQARQPTESERRCWQSNDETLAKLHPNEPFLPKSCLGWRVQGLTAKDFHVFVEGKEQQIQKVIIEDGGIDVRDSHGRHDDFSETPTGVWSTDDLPGFWGVGAPRPIYNIAFVPPASDEVGCHKVEIKVDRPHSAVYARPEYCTSQSPTDILNGTKFGNEMEQDLSSGAAAKIPLSLQPGFFYAGAHKARVQISLQFPWNSLYRVLGRDWMMHATIGTLGMIYKKDGRLAARFSDFACCSGDSSWLVHGYGFVGALENDDVYRDARRYLSAQDVFTVPSRYEAEVELPPGEYDLKVVLSDGEKFGQAEASLSIDERDGMQLALSSVMLCKRFRDAHVAAVERAAANLAPQHVPLVSKGIEFTPAGDTRFKKGEPLIPYFEVYEPLLTTQPAAGGQPAQPAGTATSAQAGIQGGHSSVNPSTTLAVQAHIRIVEATTGRLVKEFPPVDAGPYERADSSMIPIAREIPFDQLPKGVYRLEVQATDSAGGSTPWRTANFTVE